MPGMAELTIAAPTGRIARIGRLMPLSLVLLLALFIVTTGAVAALRFIHPFPLWDTATVVDAYFRLPWPEFLFFRGDNEHLPWLAMPFYAADISLFGAHGLFLIAVLLVLNAALAITLVALARPWLNLRAQRLLAAAALLALFFWLFHAENLVWPKQIHMYLSLLAFLLAVRGLVALDGRLGRGQGGWIHLSWVVLALVAASFSFAYGMIGWLAALFFALARRWPYRLLLSLAGAFALTLALYAALYAPNPLPGHTRPTDALSDPLGMLWYCLHYLGSPLRRLFFNGRELGLLGAVAGMALALVASMRALRGGRPALEVAWLSIMLFCLGAAAITSLSRLSFGAQQAETLRYGVVQVLFWAAFALWLLPWLRDRLTGRPLLLVWLLPVILALMLPFHLRMFGRLDRDQGRDWQAVLALLNGADGDPVVAERLHPSPALARRMADELSRRRLSLFAGPQPFWLDRKLAEIFTMGPAARCVAGPVWLHRRPGLNGRAYVTGSAWDAGAGRPAPWVVLANGDGRVVGLGRTLYPQGGTGRDGWQAYTLLADGDDGAELRAYAVLADGRSLCPLPPPLWEKE